MKKVYFDSRKCLGCHSCVFACAVEHSRTKDPRRAHLEEKLPVARRSLHLVEGACLTVACRQCDPAPCMEACIAGAMKREAGDVRCDTEQCIGCWMCVMACPFDAVKPGEVFTIKCDMCPDQKEVRVCVEACPTGALFLATPEEFKERSKKKKTSKAGVPA
jgi:carbon-monoxide dehydrogenase iron sulfur subunit